MAEHLPVESAVLDGEIVCVDDSGRAIFNDLLFRRRDCVFFAFDLRHLNGEDLRSLPLTERNARLKRLLSRKRSRVLYVDHIEKHGQRFFEKSAASIWKSSSRSARRPGTGRQRSRRRIGSRSRTATIRRLKDARSYSIPRYKIIRASEVGV